MRRLLSVTAGCLLCAPLLAQDSTATQADPPRERTAHNSVYVEAGGNGILYSLNYDRLFSERVTVRIGFMHVSGNFFGGSVSLTLIPIMANYLIPVGASENKVELGAGPAVAMVRDASPSTRWFSTSKVVGTATIGYRYLPGDGGFNFRIGITPMFGAGELLPWGGVSAGYGF